MLAGFHGKYSTEFKIKVVKAYLNNEGGYKTLAKKYDVNGDYSTLSRQAVANSRHPLGTPCFNPESAHQGNQSTFGVHLGLSFRYSYFEDIVFKIF